MMTNTQTLVEALNSNQRAAMAARDALRDAEDAVRHAKETLAEIVASGEFITQVLRGMSE